MNSLDEGTGDTVRLFGSSKAERKRSELPSSDGGARSIRKGIGWRTPQKGGSELG